MQFLIKFAENFLMSHCLFFGVKTKDVLKFLQLQNLVTCKEFAENEKKVLMSFVQTGNYSERFY